MAQIDNRYAQAGNARTDVVVDEGLRAYMLRVYNYMAAGILLTGLVAYVVFTQAVTTDPALAAHAANGAAYALKRGMYLTSFGLAIFASPLKWVVMLLPLGFAPGIGIGAGTICVGTGAGVMTVPGVPVTTGAGV
jgi:FtsH-binding integral membrane protein